MAETRMHVGGASPYDVVVGDGVIAALPTLVDESAARVALVHSERLAHLADGVAARLGDREVLRIAVPDGEAAKSATTAADCWERLGTAGFTRSDVVVTVGGGATTDLGGFVAATWLRGVAVVHVPTTLLGMVDAAVGGKTGIDTGAGKNLVGSFHEPSGVICDLDLLAELPRAELVSGLGEVIKCGFVADPTILEVVEAGPEAVLDPGSDPLRAIVEKAIRVKIDVVVGDLRETGGAQGEVGREVLNYGHTMAHAIERATSYAVRHGEAVALGMVYVAELSRRAGRLDEDTAARHATVLSSVGLPTRWSGAPYDELLATMRVDKKARGNLLRFVVLDALARPAILSGPDDTLLRASYDVMTGVA